MFDLSDKQKTVLDKLRNSKMLLTLAEFDTLLELVDMDCLIDDPQENIITAEVAEEVGCHCGNFNLRTRSFWVKRVCGHGTMYAMAACDACGHIYQY